jgi:ribose 5-phosphate isomerase B
MGEYLPWSEGVSHRQAISQKDTANVMCWRRGVQPIAGEGRKVMRVLVAVDDSGFAENLLRAVAVGIRHENTEVLVLHVLQPVDNVPPPEMAQGYAPELESEKQPAHAFVERLQTSSSCARPAQKEGVMRVGVASDHGGFALKGKIADLLRGATHEVVDFGALQANPGDDYPDYVIPLARAVAAGAVDRGIALCGSGVGASICANKIAGVRAGLIHDVFSAHQGVEDDDMNVFSLGG